MKPPIRWFTPLSGCGGGFDRLVGLPMEFLDGLVLSIGGWLGAAVFVDFGSIELIELIELIGGGIA